MIFRSILHLLTRGIQEKYNQPWIRWPTWSLVLVANFNTPSQLGRTSFAICRIVTAIHPSNALSGMAWPSLLCSALLELWRRNDRGCIIPSSTDLKSVSECVPLSLVPDQYHWSQINEGHPSIVSTVDTTMRPSVLLCSLSSFPCSLIRWELLPMIPRLHG